MTRAILKADRIILAILGVLLVFGLVEVYSASYSVAHEKFAKHGGALFFMKNQAVRMAIGVALATILMHIPYRFWIKIAPLIYGISIVMLIAVFFFPKIKGAQRWIDLGPVSIQASEVARIGLIMMLSHLVAKWGKERIRKPIPFLILLAVIGLIVVLVAKEPDFSSSFFIALSAIGLIYVAGVKLKHLMFVVLGGLLIGTLFVASAPYRMARVTSFLNKEADLKGDGYQQYQAKIAIGNGGVVGQGLGNGIQKKLFLPEPHTDFMFSSIAEEFGFVGIFILCSLFFIIFKRGFAIAKEAPDDEGALLATGITLLIISSFVAHTSVNVGFIPTTGIPLPFISYGGMSLVITLSGVGILLNISTYAVEAKGVK